MADPLLGPHGGYRNLRAFQLAEVVYDATEAFTRLYLAPNSRTVDQMVQAARSGRQNIAEGSRKSATSKKGEMFLIDVARASLDELLLDYEDFLRQRGLLLWKKDHPKAVFLRGLRHPTRDRSDSTDPSDIPAPYETYRKYVEDKGPENAANTIICVIHQANYLLDQLLRRLSKDFLEEGGFTEKLYRERTRRRGEQNRTDQTDQTDQSDLSD